MLQQDHNNYNSRYHHKSVESTKEFPSFTLDTVTVICYDAYNETITNSLKTTYDRKLANDKQITNEKKLTYDLTKALDCSWLQSRTRLHNQLLLLISMLFKTFNLSNPYQVMIDYDLTAMMSNNHDQYYNDDDDNKIGGVSSLVTLSHVMKIILINNSIDDSRDDSKSKINNEQRSEDVWNLIKDPFKTQLLSQIFTQYPSLQSGLLLCILLKHISSILGILKMSIFLSSMFHNSSHNDSNNNDGATTTSSYTLAKFMLKFVSFLSFTSSSDVVYPILLWFISCITLQPLPLPQNRDRVVVVSSSSSSSPQAGDNQSIQIFYFTTRLVQLAAHLLDYLIIISIIYVYIFFDHYTIRAYKNNITSFIL